MSYRRMEQCTEYKYVLYKWLSRFGAEAEREKVGPQPLGAVPTPRMVPLSLIEQLCLLLPATVSRPVHEESTTLVLFILRTLLNFL